MQVEKWPERKLGDDVCLGRNTASSGNRQDVREVRTQGSHGKVGSGDREEGQGSDVEPLGSQSSLALVTPLASVSLSFKTSALSLPHTGRLVIEFQTSLTDR